VENVLENHEVTSFHVLMGGANITEKISLRDDGGAIFKPKDGESIIREKTEMGTYYKRERAAYLVDSVLGFEMIPPTVIRKVNGKIGSCQQFVEGGKTMNEEITENLWDRFGNAQMEDIPAEERESLKAEPYARYAEDFKRLYVLDYILWNSDRHEGNFLLKDGRLVPIDHGLTFGKDKPKFAETYVDDPFPTDVIEKLKQFRDNPEKADQLRAALKELLPRNEVAACMVRIAKITKLLGAHGTIPHEKATELTY
jgi:uncharacterized repeat protein (TIGR03843 family)